MNNQNVELPMEVALYFVQQLPPSYQQNIFEWLLKNQPKNIKIVRGGDKENVKLPLKRGSGKHLIGYIADDFDEPMEDFKDYM